MTWNWPKVAVRSTTRTEGLQKYLLLFNCRKGDGGVGVRNKEKTKLFIEPVPVHAVMVHWWADYKQMKPCRLLGVFSGDAGEITMVTGDEALASESPVGTEISQGTVKTHMEMRWK